MKLTAKISLIVIAYVMVFLPEAKAMTTETRIFDPNFRTLKTSVPENFMAMPVIRLGSDDKINFTFDEIGNTNSYLQYRLIHCDAQWNRSSLVESEYLSGFNYADIDDYAFSSNTYVHYTNYSITIPNIRISPTISGNYLLQVYNPDDPDRTILQARFAVSENAFPIMAEATSRTDRGLNTTWQQVNVRLNTGTFRIPNPYSDILLIVNQNGRHDTSRLIRYPQRVSGNEIIYEHIDALIFPASNEFRRFETVRANYPGMGVENTQFIGGNYHAILYPDASRRNAPYSFDQTQKGRFMIDEYNSTDPALGADYVTVHFTLDHPYIPDTDIYLDGEFTSHIHDSSTRLLYDPDTRLYQTQIPLKQGSYNYQYVAVPRGGKPDAALIEGDKFETQNEYQIFVYLRTPGSRYDRLLSSTQIILTH